MLVWHLRFPTGIPDFRGPDGAWTLRAQGRQRTGKTVSTLQAIATPTHMALVELQNRGYLKYLVSQNCDGLHRKSGILSVGYSPALAETRLLIILTHGRIRFPSFTGIAI